MIRESLSLVLEENSADHPDVERATRVARVVCFGSWVIGLALFGLGWAFHQPLLLGAFCAWYLGLAGIVSVVVAIPRRRQGEIDSEVRRKLRDLAEHDDLTGLYNRRYFNSQLESHIALCRDGAAPLTIGLIDLNDFKSINDSFGHAAGDMALRIAGQAIVDVSPANAIVARTGGDEFALIMPGVTRDQAEVLAGRVRSAVEAANFVVDGPQGGRGRIRATVGTATLGENADPGHLLQEADSALYAGKRRLRTVA